jgi:Skp family chaperone for outer membrane proteins
MRSQINHCLIQSSKLKSKMQFAVFFLVIITSTLTAQRGVRIGYIDTEYILQNVSEYQQAQTQLENKAQKWKAEIDQRTAALENKKQQLNNERVLLTIDLIKEREEELQIIENELLEYQLKRFGPAGDLMIQKKQLTQPIQDQIFTAVQEIATTKKYDFIFDKSADVVMLYSADRYNVSEQVLRTINRTNKREQVKTKKDKKELKDEKTIVEVDNERDERQKLLDERNAKREEALAKRKAELEAKREARRKEVEEKKQKAKEERENARNAKLNKKSDSNNEREDISKANSAEPKKDNIELDENMASEKDPQNNENAKLSEREERKKALEEKKKRILAERKAKIEALKRKRDSIRNNRK